MPSRGSACGWHFVIMEDRVWVRGVFDGNDFVCVWSTNRDVVIERVQYRSQFAVDYAGGSTYG